MKKIFIALTMLLFLAGCANNKSSTTKKSTKTTSNQTTSKHTTSKKTTTSNQTTSKKDDANTDFYIFNFDEISFNQDTDPKIIETVKIDYAGEEYIVNLHSSSEGYYSDFYAVFTCDLDKHEIKLIFRFNRNGQSWDYYDGSVDECEPGWFDDETYVLKFTQDWDKIVSYELYQPSKVNEKFFLTKKIDFEYPSSGSVLENYESYSWSAETNKMTCGSKRVIEYNSNGDSTLDITYNWSIEINDWIGENKYIHEYDSENRNTLEEYYKWSTEANDWIGFSKTTTQYNPDGSSVVKYYTWSTETNDWVIY